MAAGTRPVHSTSDWRAERGRRGPPTCWVNPATGHMGALVLHAVATRAGETENSSLRSSPLRCGLWRREHGGPRPLAADEPRTDPYIAEEEEPLQACVRQGERGSVALPAPRAAVPLCVRPQSPQGGSMVLATETPRHSDCDSLGTETGVTEMPRAAHGLHVSMLGLRLPAFRRDTCGPSWQSHRGSGRGLEAAAQPQHGAASGCGGFETATHAWPVP